MSTQTKEKDSDDAVTGVSFDKNPLKYCKHIYKLGCDRIDTLRDQNEENLEFYMGIDRRLEQRRNDARVKRSAIFVHELTPAIDALVGDIIASLEMTENPIRLRCSYDNPTAEQKQAASTLEKRLNDQMRDSGYLDVVFEDQVRASHIYRSPSVVKFYWQEKKVSVPEKRTLPLLGISMGVKWTKKDYGTPMAMWLPYDQFLYPANVSSLDDADWCGDKSRKTYEELEAYIAKLDGVDDKEVKRWRADHKEYEDQKSDDGSMIQSTQESLGTPLEDCLEDDKYIVTEFYICNFDKQGNEITHHCVMIGTKYLIKNKVWEIKGPRFPYVMTTAYRLPGQIEGLSSIDRGKPMQMFHSEGFNSWADATSYRIFPFFKKSIGNIFQGEPTIEPGGVASLSDPKDFEPAVPQLSDMAQLPALMQATSQKIRNLLNAQDFEQGVQGNPYEKATSVKSRMIGSGKRAVPHRKKFGMSLINGAKLFLAFNQNLADDAEMWIEPVKIDVPSLTGVTDPEQEKQDDILLLSTMQASPLYANPTGSRKIRNLWEDMVRKFKRVQVELYVPTEQELEQDIQIQTQMAQVQLDMQPAPGMQPQGGPPKTPQPAGSVS